MSPEQQAALVSAWGSVASAVGTIVSALVAGVAIRAAKQANKTSSESLNFAREERAASLRDALFEARVSLVEETSEHLYAANMAAVVVIAHLQNSESQTDESIKLLKIKKSKLRDALADLHKHRARIISLATKDYYKSYQAYLDVTSNLARSDAEDHKHFKASLKQANNNLYNESRNMLHLDMLEPGLLAIFGGEPSATNRDDDKDEQ